MGCRYILIARGVDSCLGRAVKCPSICQPPSYPTEGGGGGECRTRRTRRRKRGKGWRKARRVKEREKNKKGGEMRRMA